jgi:hypothetical protein
MNDLFEQLKEHAMKQDAASVKFKEVVFHDPFENIDEEVVLKRLLRFFGEDASTE